MADLTKTISNRMSVSGPSPTNKWGSFLWGENWGESGDGIFDVLKLIAAGTLSLTTDITALATKLISNTLSVSSRMNMGSLVDGAGYYYVFPSSVTDPDDRYFPTWTEATEPSSSFTESTETTTTWTES